MGSHFSVYTSPPPWWLGASGRGDPWWKRTPIWWALRCLKYGLRREIGGHYAVTRSLLAGLRECGVSFSYNSVFLPSRVVLVLAGLDTLRFAIEQKRQGRIQFLAAGPNICTLPSQSASAVADDAVDVCIVPSVWVRDLYLKDCPSLSGRLFVWAAGVNVKDWCVSKSRKAFEVLVFYKDHSAPIDAVVELFTRMRVRFSVLCYGQYEQEEYRDRLKVANCMVYLQRSESQGLALAEAWAADVPTFVWNPGSAVICGNNVVACSTAPYLSASTGRFWVSIESLEVCVDELRYGRALYSPRAWVVREMSDAVCATRMLNILRLNQYD